MALCATGLVLLGALALSWPPIRPHASLVYFLLVIIMCVINLYGSTRLKGRRVPNPWRLNSGLARLQLVLLCIALVCLGVGFVVPGRFTPATLGWTWLGMGFVGFSWLANLVRVEREGRQLDSADQD